MSDKITIEEVREYLHMHDRSWPDLRTEGIVRGTRYLTTLECNSAKVADLALEQHEELAHLRAQLAERDSMLSDAHVSSCALASELMNIATAKPAEWDDPTDFRAWAQNRSRYALEQLPATAKANAKIIAVAEEHYHNLIVDGVNHCGCVLCQAVREKKEW